MEENKRSIIMWNLFSVSGNTAIDRVVANIHYIYNIYRNGKCSSQQDACVCIQPNGVWGETGKHEDSV